jgi:hypothetical protein
MGTKNSLQFFLLVILSSSLLVCASIPEYLPPEMPKPDVCDRIGEKILESLTKAGDAVNDSLPGKTVYFGKRITGQTCLSEKMGLFSVMLDFVVRVDDKTKTYVCMLHLFIIEGKEDKNGEILSRILQIYPGEEGVCTYEEK